MTTVVLNTVTRKVEVFSSARDVQARAEIADHKAAANPHPQYLGDAEVADVALSGDAGDLIAGTVPDARMPHWTGYNLASRSALEATNVPAPVVGLRLLGYAAVGDGGGAPYMRVASEPSHAGKIQSADGTWWALASVKPNVKMFGARGDDSADDAVAVQNAIDFVLADGGELFIPPGAYRLATEVVIDVRGITGAPTSNLRRVKIRGAGMGNTILKATTDSMEIMRFVGDNPLTSASHTYTELSDFSFGGATPTSRTASGLRLQDLAYMRTSNLSFHNLNVGLVNHGCLSSLFDHLVFNESVKGIVAEAGASGPHSNVYLDCEFRQLTSLAYDGLTGMSGATFINVRVEGCGTHGDSATGGMLFRMSGSAGEAGPTFIGGYIELNGGGFDFSIEENGAQRVNANFHGLVFNRISNTKHVTNAISTSGDVDLNLSACTFSSYGTYVPDAGRPYLNMSGTTRLRDTSCRWEDSVEAPVLGQTLPYAGLVLGSAGASVTGTLPNGWSVVQAATGLFTVTHNFGHTSYIVTATVNATNARYIERAVINSNSFQIKVLRTSDNVATDDDFGFQVQILKPAN